MRGNPFFPSVAISLLLAICTFGTIKAQDTDDVRTVVQTGHIAAVIDYDISADGHFAATLDKNGQAILWNLKTGHQYREFSESGANEVYFNGRSTALVIVCDKHTAAYDIAMGKRISYWPNKVSVPSSYYKTKPNIHLDALKVKRRPSYLKSVVEGTTLRVSDAATGRLVAVLGGTADDIRFVASYVSGQPDMRKADGGIDASRWWVGTPTPVLLDLSRGQLADRIDFGSTVVADTLWRDAVGNLVFWDRCGQLSRYRYTDGEPIDRISLQGTGRLHDLAFLSDNQTVVYDRQNQIWQTNLRKRKSLSLPYIDFHTKQLTRDGYDLSARFREVDKVRKYTPDQRDARVMSIGAVASPDSFFVVLNGVYVPLLMKLGSPHAVKGGNTSEQIRKHVQVSNGLDLFVGPSTVSMLYDAQLVGQYSINSATSVSLFGSGGVAAGEKDGVLSVFDTFTGRLANRLHPHKAAITGITAHPAYKLALTVSEDGTVGIFDTNERQLLAYLVSRNDGRDYIIRTPDNYYMASPYGTDAIHFAVSKDTYQFDQFDLKYNRPDIVLKRIGLADEKQVQMLHHAYEKRLRRMHFTEEMLANDFHVPTLTVTNADQLSQAVTPRQTLRIMASDTKYRLSRINVWVNGVPVLGMDGLPVTSGKTLRTDIPLTLASGHNTVQVSCMNERGAESYRQTVDVNLPAAVQKPDLWMALMGVSNYADKRFNLNYAAKDARDVEAAIRAVNSGNYREIHTLLLADNDVTREQLPRIREFLMKAGRDDAAILFYAGHGMVDSSLDYYLGTYDTDFTAPSQRAIPYDDIEQLLDGIAPLRKLLLVDACHSGEIDKDDVIMTDNQRRQSVSGGITFRAVGEGTLRPLSVGADHLNSVLTENFSNLKRGTGATIISSASGLQVAVEGQQWQNGLFSYCLMQGLHDQRCDIDGDGRLSVSELQQYCQRQVALLSGGRQQPTSRTENRQSEFYICNFSETKQ